MSNSTATPIQELDFSKYNLAPSTSAPLWRRADTILQLIRGVEVKRSAANLLYLSHPKAKVTSGKAFKEIQDFTEGEVMNIYVKVMVPNEEITDDLLATYEAKWPGSTKAYTKAIANSYVQFHYAEEYKE
jgi:hypothetical protein